MDILEQLHSVLPSTIALPIWPHVMSLTGSTQALLFATIETLRLPQSAIITLHAFYKEISVGTLIQVDSKCLHQQAQRR